MATLDKWPFLQKDYELKVVISLLIAISAGIGM